MNNDDNNSKLTRHMGLGTIVNPEGPPPGDSRGANADILRRVAEQDAARYGLRLPPVRDIQPRVAVDPKVAAAEQLKKRRIRMIEQTHARYKSRQAKKLRDKEHRLDVIDRGRARYLAEKAAQRVEDLRIAAGRGVFQSLIARFDLAKIAQDARIQEDAQKPIPFPVKPVVKPAKPKGKAKKAFKAADEGNSKVVAFQKKKPVRVSAVQAAFAQASEWSNLETTLTMPALPARADAKESAGFVIDYNHKAPYKPAHINGGAFGLRKDHYAILMIYLNNPGKRITAKDVGAIVYPTHINGRGTVNAAIHHIRKELHAAGVPNVGNILKNVEGGGYVFVKYGHKQASVNNAAELSQKGPA